MIFDLNNASTPNLFGYINYINNSKFLVIKFFNMSFIILVFDHYTMSASVILQLHNNITVMLKL